MSNSIYTPEEEVELAIVKKARFDIIGSMTKDGPPERSGDIRVLNEVMSSAEKQITDSATIRLKQEDVANSAAMADSVAELLKQARNNRSSTPVREELPTIGSDIIDVELVDGELEISPERLNPEDFVAPRFDASKIKE